MLVGRLRAGGLGLALGAGAALLWGRVPSVLLVAVGGVAGVAAGAVGIGP